MIECYDNRYAFETEGCANQALAALKWSFK